MPKYPDITVPLTGEDGNVFSIAGRVGKALRRAEVPKEEVDAFYTELYASESYDAALRKVMEWVETA